jgi:hypothetical protein
MRRDNLAGIQRLSLEKAKDAFKIGQAAEAAEWLARVPAEMRPPELTGAVHYSLALMAASQRRWNQAIKEMETAVRAVPRDGYYQRRLALLRHRQELIDNHTWETMDSKIDPAVRLRPEAYVPEVASAWACGAYYSRGRGQLAPWSRYLRISKEPPVDDPEERAAIFDLAGGYFCRFIAERTPLLAGVEVAVPIPADPDRYLARGASLPDELAKAIQAQLAIPAALGGLHRTGEEVEMKHLPRAERRTATEGLYEPGPDQNLIVGRDVLLVDDVFTTGSTVRSAASVLRQLGATTVVAAALCHTEG